MSLLCQRASFAFVGVIQLLMKYHKFIHTEKQLERFWQNTKLALLAALFMGYVFVPERTRIKHILDTYH